MKNGAVCCFTGHRQIQASDAERLGKTFDRVVPTLVNMGVTVFRAGGALGFDTYAALKIIEIKRENPDVRLELFLPCREQAKRWNEYNRGVYEFVLSRADSIMYVSDKYYVGCMQARNRALVDGADICVAYCKSEGGGTAYTVEYAREKNLKIINLA